MMPRGKIMRVMARRVSVVMPLRVILGQARCIGVT